jgi:hypothetical protein
MDTAVDRSFFKTRCNGIEDWTYGVLSVGRLLCIGADVGHLLEA